MEKATERAIEAIRNHLIDAEIWGDENNRKMNINFSYPRFEPNINEIEVGLSDVRASDGIKITYDFDRDGYVIMQPYFEEVQRDGYTEEVTHWQEVGFFGSWALEEKNISKLKE